MSVYRVDKEECPVVLFTADGMVQEGVIFLSPYASTHTGQQSPLDLMREKEQFFPFRSQAGNFTLVNKDAITHLRYQPEEHQEPPFGEPMQVQVTFFGGELLQGTLTLNMPQGKNRLIDYINAAPGWFALQGSEAGYLANGALIREIQPLTQEKA